MHGNGDLVCKSCSDDGLRDHFYLGVDPSCRRDRREVKRPRTVLSSVQRKGELCQTQGNVLIDVAQSCFFCCLLFQFEMN